MLCAFACISAHSCQKRIALPFYYYICSISLLNFPCTSTTFFLHLHGNLSFPVCVCKEWIWQCPFCFIYWLFCFGWKWFFHCSFSVKEGVEVVISYLEKVHTRASCVIGKVLSSLRLLLIIQYRGNCPGFFNLKFSNISVLGNATNTIK